MAIDRNSPVPLYHQLQQQFQEKINSGEWKPGCMIPPEHEICASYGVSSAVTRQALMNLVREGLLTRKAGKGTFVQERKAMSPITASFGLRDELIAMGMRPSCKLLGFQVEPADPFLADKLQVPLGTPLLAINRLILAGDKLFSIHNLRVPRSLVPQLRAEDLEPSASVRVIQAHLPEGLKMSHGLRTVEARLALGQERQLLGLPKRGVVMVVSSLNYLQSGGPFEYWMLVARADMFSFRATTYPAVHQTEGSEFLSVASVRI